MPLGCTPLTVDDRQTRPASPCVSICTLDEASRCIGCGRSVEQIMRWTRMTAAEQWSVIDEVRSMGLKAKEGLA